MCNDSILSTNSLTPRSAKFVLRESREPRDECPQSDGGLPVLI
jgi:hypothetical protein